MSPAKRIPRPVRGARNAARRLYDLTVGMEQLRSELEQISIRVAAVDERLDALDALDAQAQLEQISIKTAALNTRLDALDTQGREQHSETSDMLRLLHDNEPANRRLLWRLRETEDYARAFTEPEPLVSVVIPTYTNTEMLLERALPSVLAQTYERIEVVIVGDGAPPYVERAIKQIGDPRIRYSNQTLRGPYPDDPERLWHVAGGPPKNEGFRLARGRWIASMDDDDESAPNRIGLLLPAARERELEFCYGQIAQHHPDGETELLCRFPPECAHVGHQASIMHAGLRFMCGELGDALFGIPGDWCRVRRMMRIGVRMGMIDDVVVHYYPSTLWRAAGESTDPEFSRDLQNP